MFAAMPWPMRGACVMLSCTWLNSERLPHGALEQLDLAGRLVRDAEVAHLARIRQLVERRGDLLRLDQGVGAVQQQHVEVVGAQRRERLVDGGEDVLLREVEEAVADADLDWMMTCSRSAGEKRIASPNRRLAAVRARRRRCRRGRSR